MDSASEQVVPWPPVRATRSYQGGEITISFDSDRCTHARECVHRLPSVFDTDRRPWIDPDGAPGEIAAEVITHCPSGALHYQLRSGPQEQPAVPTTMDFRPNGPAIIRGDLKLLDYREFRAMLCRCGRSANKPFCDLTHRRIGWDEHETEEPK